MATPRALVDVLATNPELAGFLAGGLAAGIAHFDPGGTLTSYNPELESLLGGVPTSLAALDLRPLGDAPATPALTRASAGEAVKGEAFELCRSDGSVRAVRLSALPDRPADAGKGAGGPAGGFWLTLVDLGERRSLDVLRSQILGVVAHDLRNPLSAMRMSLAMLVKKNDMPTERRVSLAERMLGTLGRMEALVTSLVEQAQADAGGELRLKREPANLGDLVDRVHKDIDLIFPGRAIEVERRGSLEGTWDAARLERALGNLLTNAIKHGRDDRPVRVVLDGEGESNIQITVHNEGPAISDQLLPVVFEPFSIGTTEKDERRRSIGLGLFVVKHVLRAHGGEVSVRSTAQEGTTFSLSLPRSEGARAQSSSGQSPQDARPTTRDLRGPAGSP